MTAHKFRNMSIHRGPAIEKLLDENNCQNFSRTIEQAAARYDLLCYAALENVPFGRLSDVIENIDWHEFARRARELTELGRARRQIRELEKVAKFSPVVTAALLEFLDRVQVQRTLDPSRDSSALALAALESFSI